MHIVKKVGLLIIPTISICISFWLFAVLMDELVECGVWNGLTNYFGAVSLHFLLAIILCALSARIILQIINDGYTGKYDATPMVLVYISCTCLIAWFLFALDKWAGHESPVPSGLLAIISFLPGTYELAYCIMRIFRPEKNILSAYGTLLAVPSAIVLISCASSIFPWLLYCSFAIIIAFLLGSVLNQQFAEFLLSPSEHISISVKVKR